MSVERGERNLFLKDGGKREEVVRRRRDLSRLECKVLSDLTCVDQLGYAETPGRFKLVVELLSLKYAGRIRVKRGVEEEDEVPSLTAVHPSSGWYEREVYDRFGVRFAGNPDLRRILTDYGFKGHPRRKDFPLRGYYEVRYDEGLKRVVSEEVSLAQESRELNHEG